MKKGLGFCGILFRECAIHSGSFPNLKVYINYNVVQRVLLLVSFVMLTDSISFTVNNEYFTFWWIDLNYKD